MMNNLIESILNGQSSLSPDEVAYAQAQLQKGKFATMDELYVEIASSTYNLEKKHGMKLPNKARLREMGKEWYEKHKPELKETICKNMAVQSVFKHEHTIEDAHIFILIVDLIKETFTMLHAPLIALIVIKKGLLFFCMDNNEE